MLHSLMWVGKSFFEVESEVGVFVFFKYLYVPGLTKLEHGFISIVFFNREAWNNSVSSKNTYRFVKLGGIS